MELPSLDSAPDDSVIFARRARLMCLPQVEYSDGVLYLCGAHVKKVDHYMPSKYCCNPFGLHGETRKGKRAVGVTLCKRILAAGRLCAPKDLICTTCTDESDTRQQESSLQPANPNESKRGRSVSESDTRQQESSLRQDASESEPKRHRSVATRETYEVLCEDDSPQNDSPEWRSSQNRNDSPRSVAEKVGHLSTHLEALGGRRLDTSYAIDRRAPYIDKYVEAFASSLRFQLEQALLPEHMRSTEQDHLDRDMRTMLESLKQAVQKAGDRRQKITILTLAPLSWTILQVSAFFEVRPYFARQARHLRLTKGIFACPPPKTGHPLPVCVVRSVEDFYRRDEISRVSPETKACTLQRASGTFLPGRRMYFTLRETYELFKSCYPDAKVGLSTFARLRPNDVRLTTVEHKMCVCNICENLTLMLKALGGDRADVVAAMGRCDVESEGCMLNSCPDCSDGSLQEYLRSLTDDSHTDVVSYWTWHFKDGRCRLCKLSATVAQLLTEIKKKLLPFREHWFVKLKQASFLKEKKGLLQDGECLVLLDFAENFTFHLQDEVQAHYFAREQCSMFTCVVYYKRSGVLQCESLCGVTEDRLHDVIPVILSIYKILQFLRDRMRITCVSYMTDGAPQHFKNRSILWLVLHHTEIFGVPATWNYYASHHGKSSCDGIGAVVKRSLRRASLKKGSQPIQSVEGILDWSSRSKLITKIFEIPFLKIKELRTIFGKFKDCIPVVSGISKFHCADLSPSGELLLKRTSAGPVIKVVPVHTLKVPELLEGVLAMCSSMG